MSWRDAPLYIEAHDLARWIVERTRAFPAADAALVGRPLAEAACDLTCAIALALRFPATRSAHLERADEEIVRLRTLLRLARDAGLVSAGGSRFAAGRLQAVGRMLGGWRKRCAPAGIETGDGPLPARGG